MAKRDSHFIQHEATRQASAGAHFIDVNAGTLFEGEAEALVWLVQTVQAAVDVPLCIDSPNPMAIRPALEAHRGHALVNSITGEEGRFAALLPVVRDHDCTVVALCLDDAGMPTRAEGAVAKGTYVVDRLLEAGLAPDRIRIDPVVRPVATNTRAGLDVVGTIQALRARYPEIGMICGLSNFSFGLPERRLLNRAFLAACITAGLDAAILDPLDSEMVKLLRAMEVVLSWDDHCRRYLKAYRDGQLGPMKQQPDGRGQTI